MMNCDIMPTISEDVHSQEDRNSFNSGEGANIEDMLLSMLEERDRQMEALRFAQEQLEQVKSQLTDVQKEKASLEKHIETAVSQDILSCSQQISSLKDQLDEKSEEVSDLIAERNNTRLLLEHLECLVARHEKSLRMTVVKRQNNCSNEMDNPDSCGISSEVEVLKALKSLFDHHKALDDKLRNRLKSTQERSNKLQEQLNRTEKLLNEERQRNLSVKSKEKFEKIPNPMRLDLVEKMINTEIDSVVWTENFDRKLKDYSDLVQFSEHRDKDIQSLKSANSSLNDQISALKVELEKKNFSNERSVEELKRLENELNRRENQIEKQEERIKNLEKKNLKSEQNMNQNSEILHKLRTEIIFKSNQINQLEEKNSSLQHRLLTICRNSFSSENLNEQGKEQTAPSMLPANSKSLTSLNTIEDANQEGNKSIEPNNSQELVENERIQLELINCSNARQSYMAINEKTMNETLQSIKNQFNQQIALLQEEIQELHEQLQQSQEDLNRCLERETVNEEHNKNLVKTIDRLLTESNDRLQKHLEERMTSLNEKKDLDHELDRMSKILDEIYSERDSLRIQNAALKRKQANLFEAMKKSQFQWIHPRQTMDANGAKMETFDTINFKNNDRNSTSVVFSSLNGIPRTCEQIKPRNNFKQYNANPIDINSDFIVSDKKNYHNIDNLSGDQHQGEFNGNDLSTSLYPNNSMPKMNFLQETLDTQQTFDPQSLTALIQSRLNAINQEIKMIEEERDDTELRAEHLESKVIDNEYQDYINDSSAFMGNGGEMKNNKSVKNQNSAYGMERNFPLNRDDAFSPRPAAQNMKNLDRNYATWYPRRTSPRGDRKGLNDQSQSMADLSANQPLSFSTATELIDSRQRSDKIHNNMEYDPRSQNDFQPCYDDENFTLSNQEKSKPNYRRDLLFLDDMEMGFNNPPSHQERLQRHHGFIDDIEKQSIPRNLSLNHQSNDINRIKFLEQVINSGISFTSWNTNLIVQWLEVYVNMPAWYAAAAGSSLRSGSNLLAFNDHDFQRQLGISNSLHRLKLRLAIQEMMTITNNRNNSSKLSPTDYRKFIETTKLLCQLSHEWIGNEWLASLGLPQYRSGFMECLVDGRMLTSLTKKDLRSTLKMLDPFHRRSLVYGISFLKQFNFDRDQIEERRRDCLNDDSDLVVWTNDRFNSWLISLDVKKSVLVPIQNSGIHGAILAMDAQFDTRILCNSLGIQRHDHDTINVLYASFNRLIEPYRQLQQKKNFEHALQSNSEDSN